MASLSSLQTRDTKPHLGPLVSTRLYYGVHPSHMELGDGVAPELGAYGTTPQMAWLHELLLSPYVGRRRIDAGCTPRLVASPHIVSTPCSAGCGPSVLLRGVGGWEVTWAVMPATCAIVRVLVSVRAVTLPPCR
eukprot:2609953-Pleurochrysis_carterae.AAC.3